jgi:hypothetical protein
MGGKTVGCGFMRDGLHFERHFSTIYRECFDFMSDLFLIRGESFLRALWFSAG